MGKQCDWRFYTKTTIQISLSNYMLSEDIHRISRHWISQDRQNLFAAPSCRFLPRLTRRIETERQERQEHIANMFELEEEEAGPPRRSSRFYCSLSCVSQQRNNELFQKREESQDNWFALVFCICVPEFKYCLLHLRSIGFVIYCICSTIALASSISNASFHIGCRQRHKWKWYYQPVSL